MPQPQPRYATGGMKPEANGPLQLVPESGIEVIGGHTVAITTEAWLRVEPTAAFAQRKWIRLRYATGFFDEPVRPLIRFKTRAGLTITLPMNGPVLGSAEWIGRVPDGTVSVSVSPVRRKGPFAFRIERISSVSRVALLQRALRRPDWLYWAVRSWLLNSRREAWQSLCFAACGTAMAGYDEWRARFARRLERDTFDCPRSKWDEGPSFHLMLDLKTGDAVGIARTVQSLYDQIYSRWHLYAVNASNATDIALAAFRRHAAKDPRLMEATPDALSDRLDRTASNASDFVAVIEPGDLLPAYALAVVAEEAVSNPALEFIFGDEDRVSRDGRFSSPMLKPDWSPVFQQHRTYLGHGGFLRVQTVDGDRALKLISNYHDAIAELARTTSPGRIRHIRRLLYSRAETSEGSPQASPGLMQKTDDPPQWPPVAVVIPTRDQAKLLEKCIAGLRQRTDYPELEIVIVDNGSTQADAVQLLRALADQPRTNVLQRPGPFNFSALCNDGARVSDAPVLLFFNNDVVTLEPGWLKAMVRLAIGPEIGAVGAKLLFANGLIQHAGVVLGFGGIAGHVYRRLRRGYRGYLDQLIAPREVAAVTAACVVIERSKFETVGGFDADNLPVDLNDIDLCLRLAERGWTNLWTPEATLIHLQSATRGIDADPYVLYQKEREYFVQRWAEVIRDDPFFHPALSLYAHKVALA